MSERYTITAALPYTNGPIHIGHLAGVYVPADIFARYQRLKNNDVAFICGSDEHGVAISIKAKKEGTTPKQIIDKYHIKHEHQALKEDFEFNIKVFNMISNFYILNEPLYFYMKRNNGSLTAKFVPDYFSIHMKTLSSFIKLLQVRGELNQNAIELVVNRFIRYTLSAIERNTSPNANLTLKAQKDWIIGSVYNQEQFKLMVNNAYLVSKKQKPIYFLLKYKISSLLVLLGNFVKLVKSKLPILFTKLKG